MSQASTQKRIIRAVVLDVDGTLICRDGTICSPNHHAIARLLLAGVPVILATGRIPTETVGFYGQLELSTPMVCYHGALVLAGRPQVMLDAATSATLKPSAAMQADGVLHDAPLSPTVVNDLVRYVLDMESEAQILIGTSQRYVLNRLGKLASYWDMKGPSRPMVGPLTDVLGERVYKVCYFSEDTSQVSDIAGRVGERFGGVFQHQQAHAHLAEFLAPGVSKAGGVDLALQHVGRQWDETMAIGDFHNDMEMLRRAAIGVAMANACPELKAMADYVTGDRDEGGVAEAIDRFVQGA